MRAIRLRELRSTELGKVRRSRIRVSNPTLPGQMDVINQPIYDSASVAATTAMPNTTRLFASPAGQGGKTLWDTNMQVAGQLQNPQKLLLRAFRFIVQADANPTDAIALLYNTWLNFVIGQKPYFQGPTFLWSGGVGIHVQAAQIGTAPAGAGTVSAVNNGFPDQRAIFALSRPFVLEQGENFYVEVNIGAAFNTVAADSVPAGTGLRFYVALDGELFRGVQ